MHNNNGIKILTTTRLLKIGSLDGPPGSHLHWYGQQKLTTKSIKPTQKKTKYNNILLHTHAHKCNTN